LHGRFARFVLSLNIQGFNTIDDVCHGGRDPSKEVYTFGFAEYDESPTMRGGLPIGSVV
jgi:hypothetical protein